MYVAGFDGGGSTARLAIATPTGEVVFRQEARGINAIDNPDWQVEYEKLFTAAGDYMTYVQSACFGISGWGEIAERSAAVSSWLRVRLGCHIRIMNDVELAHRAFFADKAGILLLSGTGSMALGRTKEGEFIRVGGFGHILGDEGGAYWLGQRALMRLARESDGRAQKSAFGEALSKRLGINLSLESIMNWLNGGQHMRSHVATVSAILDEMAERGDPVAKTLLVDAAKELYEAYQAVYRRLRGAAHARNWTMAGSTFHSRTLSHAVRNFIGFDSIKPMQPALDKALQIAYQELST